MNKGFPHHDETAYRKGISCADAIFSTQEAVCVMADTPHYAALISKRPSIPLNTLFYLSICSSLVLMANVGTSFVTGIQTPEVLSGLMAIRHNVFLCVVELSRAGSVLSPTLFIIVIDSLLTSLDTTHQGLSHQGLGVGSSAHADDIRVVSNSVNAVSRLGSCVNSFCSENQLKLNAGKTEAVSFSKGCPPATTLQIASDSIKSQPQIKCLGVWWQDDLSPSIYICRGKYLQGSAGILCHRLIGLLSW